jgi:hypothetical protein
MFLLSLQALFISTVPSSFPVAGVSAVDNGISTTLNPHRAFENEPSAAPSAGEASMTEDARVDDLTSTPAMVPATAANQVFEIAERERHEVKDPCHRERWL